MCMVCFVEIAIEEGHVTARNWSTSHETLIHSMGAGTNALVE